MRPKTMYRRTPVFIISTAIAIQCVVASAGETRRWTDNKGRLLVDAELFNVAGEFVVLRRQDGTSLALPIARLSNRDREHIRDVAKKDNRTRLVVQVREESEVLAVAVSPDGRKVITGGLTARVWDARTGREVSRLEGHLGPVTSVAFSPDGRQVLTASGWHEFFPGDSTTRLWDSTTGKEIQRFEGHTDGVYAVAFSANGQQLLTGGGDKIAWLWDAATGNKVRKFEGHASLITSVAFSPDGRQVLTGSLDRTARLWDATTGKEIRNFDGYPENVISVNFSPDGRQLLTGSSDGSVLLWDGATGKAGVNLVGYSERALAGYSGRVFCVAFSTDGRQLLTGSGDCTARLWDALTGKQIRVFEGHTRFVRSVAFSHDGRRALTGGFDKTARLWDAATGKELLRFEGHTKGVESVALSPDGKYALTGSWDKTARMWDAATGKEVNRFEGHSSYVHAVAFSPNGQTVLTGSRDGSVRLWDGATGKEVCKIEAWGVTSVAFSPNAQRVLTGSLDKTARLWNASTGKEVLKLEGHSRFISSVAFSPDSRRLLTGSSDETLRMWDASTGRELRKFAGNGRLRHVVFLPSGRHVLAWDKVIRRWDTTENEFCKYLQNSRERSKSITSMAFSPDGQQVLTGSEDGTSRLWDFGTGKEVRTFDDELRQFDDELRQFDDELRQFDPSMQGEESLKFNSPYSGEITNNVTSVAFSANGRHVVTGRGDGTAQLWDTATGEEICSLEGEESNFLGFAQFSADGRRMVVTSFDGTRWLWDVSTGREIGKIGTQSSEYVLFSPDGRYMLTLSVDGDAQLWDAATGKTVRKFETHSQRVASVVVSPDGRHVCSVSGDGTKRFWDLSTGRQVVDFDGGFDFGRANLSPDGKQRLTISGNAVFLRDAATGDVMRAFVIPKSEILKSGELELETVRTARFSPDGRQVLTGSELGNTRLWDIATGDVIHTFGASVVGFACFSPAGRHVLTGSPDGTVRIWDAATGKELCKLVSFRDGWAVVGTEGRFDASNGGDVKEMHWVFGNEPIALNQLKERYYEPGLLAKIMGFNKEPLRDVSAFENPKLYPEVKLVAPTKENQRLAIDLKRRDGGFGRVVVKVNGKELTTDARGLKENGQVEPRGGRLVLSVDLSNDPKLKPGTENEIEVFAFNEEGYLRSRGLKAIYTPPGKTKVTKPDVWAVVVGASDYRGKAIDLRYAAKDADDFAKALRVASTRLFGEDKLHLTLLSTTQDDPANWPTKVNLTAAMDAAKKAKPGDILVMYLAGHGVNHGGQDGDFYYLTSSADSAELRDPAVREQVSISSHELTEYIKQIPALKQVLVLDTCAAGRFVQKLTDKRHIPTSQIRALERVKDRTGMYVLAGCAADAASYEASNYGQGLLTHSLLLGMRGAALREGQYVDVARLFNFASDRVPQLAQGVGGIQRPVMASPRGGASFDIGQVADVDKALIPLQSPRPMVLRASFQKDDEDDAFDIEDNLGLAAHVNEQLRDMSSRGPQPPLVFVDSSQLPSAYSLVGRYEIQDDKVKVRVQLKKERERKDFIVEGQSSDVAQLARRIAEETKRRLTAD